MVAWENFESIARASSTKMAMSFVGPCDGKIVAPRQQFEAEKRRSEVKRRKNSILHSE